jgi:hypothetical protein
MTGATADELWPLVRDHHYSRRMPSAPQHCFAIRRPGGLFGDTGEPVAGIIYGSPVNKYISDGIAVELLRLVRAPDYRRPLSHFVTWSLRWLRANTRFGICVTYADTAHGHYGGIYQACGFQYLGERGVPFDKVAGFKDQAGNFWHARSVNARYGTHQKDKILDRNPSWSVVEAQPKHFYFTPLRKHLKPTLKHYGWQPLVYPKPNAVGPLDERPPSRASFVQPEATAPEQVTA